MLKSALPDQVIESLLDDGWIVEVLATDDADVNLMPYGSRRAVDRSEVRISQRFAFMTEM